MPSLFLCCFFWKSRYFWYTLSSKSSQSIQIYYYRTNRNILDSYTFHCRSVHYFAFGNIYKCISRDVYSKQYEWLCLLSDDSHFVCIFTILSYYWLFYSCMLWDDLLHSDIVHVLDLSLMSSSICGINMKTSWCFVRRKIEKKLCYLTLETPCTSCDLIIRFNHNNISSFRLLCFLSSIYKEK